jgi:bifunctional non-homologous end joining protein LigD
MQATPAREIPAGPRWCHELQHGGLRCLVRRDGGVVRHWLPDAGEIALPAIVEGVRGLAADVLIDGEAVVLSRDGQPEPEAVFTRPAARRAVLIASDLLMVDGEDLRGRPLRERRDRLAELIADATGIDLAETFVDGTVLLREAGSLGLPGIVSKRLDSLYREGSSNHWVSIAVRTRR